jgi:hypothetical protein
MENGYYKLILGFLLLLFHYPFLMFWTYILFFLFFSIGPRQLLSISKEHKAHFPLFALQLLHDVNLLLKILKQLIFICPPELWRSMFLVSFFFFSNAFQTSISLCSFLTDSFRLSNFGFHFQLYLWILLDFPPCLHNFFLSSCFSLFLFSSIHFISFHIFFLLSDNAGAVFYFFSFQTF